MRMKRVTSIVAALVMMFSLMAGIGFAPNAAAKVTSELPKTTGLFVAAWYNMSWDDELRKDVVITSKDQYGNTVPVDVQDQVIPYRDCENPEYLTKGIEEGWGFGMPPVESFWFDYVDGKKVTHVPASKLKVTHLDGSACNDVTVKESDQDSRLVDVEAKVMEPVMITYTGGKKNNKMILMPNLPAGFYTTDKRSAEGYISDDLKVVNGKQKEVYVHLSNDMLENSRYIVDFDKCLSVSYKDRDSDTDNDTVLTGADAAGYAKASVISDKDPHDMSYKVTLSGIAPNSDWMYVSFDYREYDVNEGEDKAEARGLGIWVNFVEGNVFEGAHPDAFGYSNGKIAIVDEGCYGKDANFSAPYGQPMYVSFRYTDADGNQSYITDKKDISLYQFTRGNDEQPSSVGDKLPDEILNLVQITQPNPDSPVLKIVIPKIEGMGEVCAAVGYKDQKPEAAQCIIIEAGEGIDCFYSTSKATPDTSITEISSDGTIDLTVYLGIEGGEWFKSAKYKYVTLIDENGNSLGSKVKVKDTKMSIDKENGIAFAKAITIPAGTLSGSAIMSVDVDIENNYGGNWTEKFRLYIPYKAPKKGTSFKAGGLTYTVTGKNTAVLAKVKASAKSVTIPAKVGAFKINGIGKFAMDGCKKLKKIVVKTSDIKLVGTLAFRGVPASAVATVPKAKKAAYEKLFKKQGYKGKVK